MERIRRLLVDIGGNLKHLNPNQRLLIGSLGVILVMALLLVSQYAGKTSWRPLVAGLPTESQEQAAIFVSERGIKSKRNSQGEVMVPVDQHGMLFAQFSESGGLPDDASIVFENILEHQKWTNSKEQNAALYTIALQNELGRVIANFNEIRSAKVLLDVPEAHGIGQIVRRPTASATVFTASGKAISQESVDAIATLIAGARAGLEVERVRVIDGSTGRQRQPTGDDQVLPTTYIEHTANVENRKRDQLLDLLGYIPRVIVAVTAQVDVRQVTEAQTQYLDNGEGTVSMPLSESGTSESQSSREDAAAPGPLSNQAADIRTAGGDGAKYQRETNDIDFENRFGVRTQQVRDPRGMPLTMAATVSVPASYVRAVLEREAGEGAAEITEADIEARFLDIQTDIERTVRPHLATLDENQTPVPGTVEVSLVPDDIATSMYQGEAAGGVLGIGGSTLLVGGVVDKAVLGVLATVAIGMMVMMVRKASRASELPTAEELVGIPPPLETHTDLIGEVDESASPMVGIEVGEEDVQAKQFLEQVGEMVRNDPEGASRLLGRWMEVED